MVGLLLNWVDPQLLRNLHVVHPERCCDVCNDPRFYGQRRKSRKAVVQPTRPVMARDGPWLGWENCCKAWLLTEA